MSEKKNEKKNLKQKLIEVSKSIGYLQKDKTNKMQGYSYLSEAKIKETIKAAFEEQGIMFNYSTNDVREYEISPTHKGTKQFCTIAQGTYLFADIDTDEQLYGNWAGSGTDTGDKGLYKAITGGIKYVLNTNFLIPTGDDPENDSGKSNGKDLGVIEEATPKNETEIDKLKSLAFNSPKIAEAFMKSFKGTKQELVAKLKSRINEGVA